VFCSSSRISRGVMNRERVSAMTYTVHMKDTGLGKVVALLQREL